MPASEHTEVGAPVLKRRAPTFALLDESLRLCSVACEATVESCGLALRLGAPPPAPIAELVRDAVDTWSRVIVPSEVLHVIGTLLVRIVPVAALDGVRVGLFLEPFNPQRNGHWAREFYGLSVREAEVLDLLLAGYSTAEIAAKLQIASSTAADHIKRLLQKTNSSTRLELFSRVLR